MKLIQLNIWAGKLINNVIKTVDEQQPDILCLQEAISFDGDIYSLFGTIEELQSKINKPFRSVYYSPGMRFRLMHKSAGWGNCILSQPQITKKYTKFTHLDFVEDFNFDEYDYNNRNFQHCVVKVKNGKLLHVLNHHGYHIPDHKDGNEETLKQMTELGEYIDSLSGPIILAGDFNLAPHSQSLEQLNRRLRNLSIEFRLKTTRNSLTHKKEVCDYIFVNDKVKMKKFETLDDLLADHKALMLEFDV